MKLLAAAVTTFGLAFAASAFAADKPFNLTCIYADGSGTPMYLIVDTKNRTVAIRSAEPHVFNAIITDDSISWVETSTYLSSKKPMIIDVEIDRVTETGRAVTRPTPGEMSFDPQKFQCALAPGHMF
jgi:hypothetical protein